MKKLIALLIIIGLIPLGYYGYKKYDRAKQYEETHSTVEVTQPEETTKPEETDNQPSAINHLPEINLPVDFYSQAPYADWSMPYQEACEEASLILAYNYVQGIDMTLEGFHTELLALVDWETAYFGSYEHTTVAETAEMLEEFYGFTDWKILTDPTAEDLQAELLAGNPIVAPFAGRMLGNPNFTGEGPYYHMLVIRGYDENYFITNDVGTRLGENYQYEKLVLINALHDWHDTDISTLGEKKVLVLTKGE